MELLSSDRLSKAITLKTQVLPVPDLAWEIRSKTQHPQSHNLTHVQLLAQVSIKLLIYVIQCITATLSLSLPQLLSFYPTQKLRNKYERFIILLLYKNNNFPQSPGLSEYPVLILYIIYMSTTGVQSVYQAFNAE